VTALYRRRRLEITTYRTEAAYSDGRRPDAVYYAGTIEEDLSRRDFTMNAAAVRLPDGMLVDPFDGRGDIRRRLIRCVGKAEERFADDGLRPLRAVRFAAQLRFNLEPGTLAAIPGALSTTARVAAERIREELDKTIASSSPRTGLLIMEETGLLRLVLPELDACRGVEQKGFHRFDVLNHSLWACAYAAERGFSQAVRLAALFHDLGKPPVRKKDETGVWTFYNHERESVRLAEGILRRFRYPNAAVERVLRLIAAHMFHYEENWRDSAVRRFIIRTGEDLIPELFDLRLADAAGTAGIPPDPALLLPFQRRIESVLEKNAALSRKDLAVTGSDLLKAGIAPGKRIGIILHELLEAVVDDPELNRRERLFDMARRINEERYGG
jgi:tRNA nucleotidyltransferase/poly(A) polymerase